MESKIICGTVVGLDAVQVEVIDGPSQDERFGRNQIRHSVYKGRVGWTFMKGDEFTCRSTSGTNAIIVFFPFESNELAQQCYFTDAEFAAKFRVVR